MRGIRANKNITFFRITDNFEERGELQHHKELNKIKKAHSLNFLIKHNCRSKSTQS